MIETSSIPAKNIFPGYSPITAIEISFVTVFRPLLSSDVLCYMIYLVMNSHAFYHLRSVCAFVFGKKFYDWPNQSLNLGYFCLLILMSK